MNVSFSRNHTNKYLRGIISSQVDATIIIRRFSGISVQQLLTKTFLAISRHLRHVFTGTRLSRPLVCAVVADEWTVLGKLASIDVAVLVQRRRLITGFWANQRRPAAFQWRLAIPEHQRHNKMSWLYTGKVIISIISHHTASWQWNKHYWQHATHAYPFNSNATLTFVFFASKFTAKPECICVPDLGDPSFTMEKVMFCLPIMHTSACVQGNLKI